MFMCMTLENEAVIKALESAKTGQSQMDFSSIAVNLQMGRVPADCTHGMKCTVLYCQMFL